MNQKFGITAYRSCLLWGVLSSMSVAACTFFDALLVGNLVGSDGLAVTGIMTPVFLLFSLLGVTLAMGANVLMSREIGAGDVKRANQIMGEQLFVAIAVGAVLLVLSLAFCDPILRFLGANKALFAYAKEYLLPVFIASPFFVIYQVLAFSVRTDGNSKLSAAASAVVIVVNLALDLLFMGPLQWGIKGASISLCIAEVLGTLLLLCHFPRKAASLKLSIKLPAKETLADIVKNGFAMGAAFIFQAAIMLVFNRLLLMRGPVGVLNTAIFSVMYTISTIPAAFYDGTAGAFAPVIPFFSGEMDSKSIISVHKFALCFTGIVIALFTAAFMLIAEPLVVFFGIDSIYGPYAAEAFRIFAVSIGLSGINVVMMAYWQTVGRPQLATVMSTGRNLAVILLLGLLLIPRYGINGVAYAYVGCEALCLLYVILVGLISPTSKFVRQKYQPTGKVYEKFYTIKTDSISEVAQDIERLCDEWEIAPKQSFLLNFIAEEIILNIIKFALSDTAKAHYIDLKILENGDDYIFRLRDDIKLYNPFESEGDDVDNAVLSMIRKKSKYCEYRRKLVFNYLYLIV